MAPIADDITDEESIEAIIRRECGDEIADRFVKAYGGVRCSIPADPSLLEKSRSKLVKVFGLDDAKRIATATGFVSEVIPMGGDKGFGLKRRKFKELALKRKSVRDIALDLEIHERTCFRMRDRVARRQRSMVINMLLKDKSYLEIIAVTVWSYQRLTTLRKKLVQEGKLSKTLPKDWPSNQRVAREIELTIGAGA